MIDVNNTRKINTAYGTGLAATSTLTPGSLVLKLHTPNLLLVEKDSLQNVCSYCILERPSLKRCSGCKVLYYCSTACQNRHWKDFHSRECKSLKKLPDVPPTAVRALIVMLLRNRNDLEGGEEGDWKGLESHVGELKGDVKKWEEIFLQARAGVEFTKAGAERIEEAIRWLCVVSNFFFRDIGSGNQWLGFSDSMLMPNLAVNKRFPHHSSRQHPSWALFLAYPRKSKSLLHPQRFYCLRLPYRLSPGLAAHWKRRANLHLLYRPYEGHLTSNIKIEATLLLHLQMCEMRK